MADMQRMARVFVELADTLVAEFDMIDFLQGLTEKCVEVLDADAAGLMLTDQRGHMQLLASTTPRARTLELFELQANEGPSLECFSTGAAITNIDLSEARLRWPAFTAAAAKSGFGATHALPMRLRGQIIGALSLFADRQARLSDDQLAVVQAMADIATIGLLHERNLFDQQLLSQQLQAALHSRVLVEQAKGMLAARADITVSAAFTRMRAHARQHNLTLTAVATAVVEDSVDARILTSAN